MAIWLLKKIKKKERKRKRQFGKSIKTTYSPKQNALTHISELLLHASVCFSLNPSTFSGKSRRLVLSDHGDGAHERVSSHADGSATCEEGAYGLGHSSSGPKSIIFTLPPYRSLRSILFP
jgi:hypothetical protein